MGKSYYKWTTKDEIRFIDGLGTWTGFREDRHKLLQGYRESLKKRVLWDDIIAVAVLEYLKEVQDGSIESSK